MNTEISVDTIFPLRFRNKGIAFRGQIMDNESNPYIVTVLSNRSFII